MLTVTEYFECQCHSDEHTLKFSLDEDDGSLYTSVFLHDYKPWYKKVWPAIKYIFGHTSKYGHWDCFEMQPKDHRRFIKLIQQADRIHSNSVLKHNFMKEEESNGNQEETTISRS